MRSRDDNVWFFFSSLFVSLCPRKMFRESYPAPNAQRNAEVEDLFGKASRFLFLLYIVRTPLRGERRKREINQSINHVV
jgi:hypothetical protein